MDREKLPENLQEKLRKAHPKEKLLIALRSDIVGEAKYGEEWLFVTEKRVIVLSGSGRSIHDISLASVKKSEAIDLVGSGVIELTIGSSVSRVIMFSNAKTPDFYQAADDINELARGRKVAAKESSVKKVICESCHEPIPEYMNKCPQCTDKSKTLMRVMRFAKPHTGTILVVISCTLFLMLSGLVTPYLSRLFLDFVFYTGRDHGPMPFARLIPWISPGPSDSKFPYWDWFYIVTAVLFLSSMAQLFFQGLSERFSGKLGYSTAFDVRSAIYEKLQELSLSYFDKHQTGAILSRVNQDTGEVQRFLVDFFPLTVEAILYFFGIGYCLFKLNWQLTLYMFLPMVFTVIFLGLVFPRVWYYFIRFYHKRSMLSALVNDSVSGMRVIKAFGQEKVEVAKFKKRSAEFRDAGIQVSNQWGIYHPILHAFITLGTILAYVIGGPYVSGGKMTIGQLMAYIGYLAMFYRPVFILTRMVENVGNSLSAAERVFDVIDTEPEIKDPEGGGGSVEIKGAIEFRNASFGYSKFKPVIKKLSVKIEPNEMIGLVGRSGAGKSTFVNLVCRLYDVNNGELLIDGRNIKDIKVSELRSQIGIVLQETFLFNGTIYDNIAYAKPGATKEEVIAASVAANAHEFILKKPDGYDTDVGERGNNLSGGEKQMVSIARAILRNPRILILDEATSSVDVQTEKKIQDALEKLTKSRTTIAIAHRLSTLRNCNRVIVIKDGKIVEVGTHKELMDKKGLFHKLITMQAEFSKQASKAKAV